MRRGLGGSPVGRQNLWYIVGWGLIVVVGIALVWFGFSGSGPAVSPAEAIASPTVAPTAAVYPTALPTAVVPAVEPTQPQPTRPQPTSPLPTPTPPPTAKLVAGDDGVNVRTGPDTSYTRIGYLEPGASAVVTGKYEDWFQIEYDGGVGWVFGDLVAATDTDNVPVIQPPAAPTAAPAQPTAVPTTVPPTAVPTQPQDTRGIVVNSYVVRGAPGPYGIGAEIWFDFNITNKSGQTLQFNALGTWVEQTGQYQKSWTYSSLAPNQNFVWSDKLKIPAGGTYNLWLAIEFADGAGVLLRGPVVVNVQ